MGRKKAKITVITILSFVLIVISIVVVDFLFIKDKLKEVLIAEAGSEMPEVSEFLLREYRSYELIDGLDASVDMHEVAVYPVEIKVYGRSWDSELRVVDTIAPRVEVRTAEIYDDETLEPEDLIVSIEDETATEVDFEEMPDFTEAGVHKVTLEVTDQGGNRTLAETEVTVVEDTEPPVITGVTEQTIPAGTSVSYKRGVTVTDNHDEDVELVIDNSAVNLNEPGDYPVRYLAVDRAGNTAEVTTILHVERPSVENATEELVNQMADEVLAEILTEDKTEYEKAEAIFWWVHDIRYKDGTPKTNWVQGAYRGLADYTGDCFVYAMTAKCLLTRAGIKNMDIEKIPAYTRHYWNLIDLGDGWYHFDCCNGRMEGTYIFYWTDEQIMEYSENHNGSHNYDRDKYPEIQ